MPKGTLKPKAINRSFTSKNTMPGVILIIIMILITAGSLTLPLYKDCAFRSIDDKSEWISFTYHAYAGGLGFHYHSWHNDASVWMKITGPGCYNITYHFQDKGTDKVNMRISEWSVNDTIWPSEHLKDICIKSEFYDGWLVNESDESDYPMLAFSIVNKAYDYRLPHCKSTELEWIEVNGDAGYFTTSLRYIKVDDVNILACLPGLYT